MVSGSSSEISCKLYGLRSVKRHDELIRDCTNCLPSTSVQFPLKQTFKNNLKHFHSFSACTAYSSLRPSDFFERSIKESTNSRNYAARVTYSKPDIFFAARTVAVRRLNLGIVPRTPVLVLSITIPIHRFYKSDSIVSRLLQEKSFVLSLRMTISMSSRAIQIPHCILEGSR